MKKNISMYVNILLVVILFTSVSTSAQCVNLTKTLKLGSKNNQTQGQVTLLQNFLIKNGYLKTNSTGVFGPTTLAALNKFQISNNLQAVGSTGPKTRLKIKELSCVSSVLPVSKTNTMSSEKGKFTVNLPEGWTLQENSAVIYPNTSIDILPPTGVYTSEHMAMSINLVPRKASDDNYLKIVGKIPTVDEVNQNFIRSREDEDENFEYVNTEKTTFLGKEAYVINFKYGGDYGTGKYIMIHTPETIFTISRIVANAKSGELNTIIDTIISSIVLK